MSENCNHDCGSCGQNCSERKQDQNDFRAPANPGSNVKKVIAVMSGKGGVGKSLVTSLLAVMAQRRGDKAAILDADITGPSIPRMFGLKEKAEAIEGGMLPVASKLGTQIMSLNLLMERETDPVVWRGPVVAGVVKQFWSDVVWGDIDCMFVDMPPGTGDVPLTVFQSLPIDGIIIVTSPQELVSMIVSKAVNMAKLMKIPVLGVVENMSYAVCPDCGKEFPVFGESKLPEVAKEWQLPILGKIPMNIKLAAACDKGMIELFEGNWLDAAMEKI
ncbi:Mrp/NBP35 family ATP-binding protein [bacterium]|nr:Mrp/NBP35 family ATP-binding protein [bacterium]